MSGLHSLATIIKRLEAATSRIEDIATAKSPESTVQKKDDTNFASPATRPAPSSVPKEDPAAIVSYDRNVMEGPLKPFIQLTASFGAPNLIEIVGKFEKLYQAQRLFLHRAATCRKPDQGVIDSFLTTVQRDIEDIQNFKEANRKERDFFNHLTMISEGAISVAWLAHSKPGSHIIEVKDTVNYNGNRIIKEFKDKDPKHVEWVRGFVAILEELRKYAVEFHTTGIVWNAKGIAVESYNSGPKAAGGAPPPPPPPPPPAPIPAPAPASSGGATAVFAEINRGEAITQGLRKVDKSEMTHKNPALRGSSVVPASPSSPAGKKPVRPSKPQALMGKKPSKLALEGSKWAIEYQENESSIVLDNVQLSHSVNIFGCKNSTISIKGKVNAVTMVNSPKTQVLVESVLSSISVTNSPSFAVQVTGKAPMIQIDSTDSGQVYISEDCLDVEITTAKCSSININIPVEGEEEGVFSEQPVPEMLKSVIQRGKLVTATVDHMG